MRKWHFAPTPRDPGLWSDIINMYPNGRGAYRTAPTFAAYSTAAAGPATPGTTLSASIMQVVDSTLVAYVGTTTKLYSATSAGFAAGTFTDRSKGGGYTNTATAWSFAQFGNITIAANRVDAMQFRDATTANAFADLAGAPKAKILVVQSNVLLAFNVNDGAEKPHSWQATDVADYTNWATGDAVTATPILNKPGPITKAIAFKEVVVVFKANSMYEMRYVGSPYKWIVNEIVGAHGCPANGDVINLGDRLCIFGGPKGAQLWDGANFQDLGDGFFSDSLGSNALALSSSAVDNYGVYCPAEGTIAFCQQSQALVFNEKTRQWGRFSFYVNAASGVSSSLIALKGDADSIKNLTTSAGYTLGKNGLFLVNLSANPCVMVGTNVWTPAATVYAYAVTNYMGNDKGRSLVSRAYPVLANPSAVTSSLAATGLDLIITTYDNTNGIGSAVLTTQASSTNQNRFDKMADFRWATAQVRGTGQYFELEDIEFDVKPSGKD